MRPAFSSTRAAAAFALLLFVLLVLPAVVGKNLLPPRAQAYDSLSWGCGPYPWIRQQIFAETNPIDIVFMGSSHMVNAIDTPLVQAALSQRLGRPAVVRTLAWGGPGYDGVYLVARDLLEHRQVHQLVFYDEKVEDIRNTAATSLFRFSDDQSLLRGLPFTDQSLYYFASVIGMPRNLLSLIRPNFPAEPRPDRAGYIAPLDKTFSDASMHLGAIPTRAGFNSNSKFLDNAPFKIFQPPPNPHQAVSYTRLQPDPNFKFSNSPTPAWQTRFAREFSRLAASHGCQLVMLDLPTLASGRAEAIQERTFWPAIFSTNLALVGIPPGQLFQGLSDDEIKLLYSDRVHMNQNGMDFFTPLVMPTLFQLYDAATNH